MRSIVTCANSRCRYDSIMYKPFSALSLSFQSSLDVSLKRYFERNKFDSQNKYKCEKCGEKTRADHSTEICYLPEVLVFHVKRFQVFGAKINKFFEYRKEIKMSPFINSSDNVDG